MRAVSREIRDDILFLIDNGESDRQIARKKPVSRATVQRIGRTFRPCVSHPKTGRSPTLTERERRFLVRAVTVGGLETAVQANVLLRAELGIVVSNVTVRCALRMEGLEAAVKEKKPKLSPKNAALRLEFARKYKDWTVADWTRVLWSDETKILRFNTDGRSWCWVRDVEAREPRTVQQTVKHGHHDLGLYDYARRRIHVQDRWQDEQGGLP